MPAKQDCYATGWPLSDREVTEMLRWIVILLVLALVAGVLGFGGIAGAATDIARILFFVLLVVFVLGLIFGRGRLR